MKLFKEVALATALTLAAFVAPTPAEAHEIKFKDLVIVHPWARKSPMGADVAAGFMSITNNGKEDDKLISATAEVAPMVQLHDMKMEGDVMKMFEVPGGIAIPAGATVDLKPKHMHVMFMKMPKELPPVDTMFKGTLTFEKAGTVEIEYDVADPNAGMN
ncbi:MAG: copper chaperone PCu(A)C [Hyphomicrobiales bacterium]